MILMNTHIVVKRRSKCKNVGTVSSVAQRKEKIGEPGSKGGGGSRGNNYGNIGESQQHQHSTAAAQQQRV